MRDITIGMETLRRLADGEAVEVGGVTLYAASDFPGDLLADPDRDPRSSMGTFGGRLRALRLDAGMSTRALAKELGASAQTVSKWERGESWPGSQHLIALSRLFGVSTDFLLVGLHLRSLELCIGAAWACGSISRGKALELARAFSLDEQAIAQERDATAEELQRCGYAPREVAA